MELSCMNAERRREPRPPTILWVDDDLFFLQSMVEDLRDAGFTVLTADGPDQALGRLRSSPEGIDLVLLDIAMPHGSSLSPIETRAGFSTGLALARTIQREIPRLPIVAFSIVTDSDVMDWFRKNTLGFVPKPTSTPALLRVIQKALGEPSQQSGPRIFIVHGHDDTALFSLKSYLQNTLGFSEPVILRERPSRGRTIIEKFEEVATEVDLVFVLVTPDDTMVGRTSTTAPSKRARQNVVFELGYFCGKLSRTSGRIVVLHKGPVELPSDILGVVYIDIGHGVESAGEEIRRELSEWLPQSSGLEGKHGR